MSLILKANNSHFSLNTYCMPGSSQAYSIHMTILQSSCYHSFYIEGETTPKDVNLLYMGKYHFI